MLLKLALLLLLLIPYEAIADTNYQVGVTAWNAPDVQVRYLPNYSTSNPYKSTELFGKINSNINLTEDIEASAWVQHSENYGTRIDQLSLTKRFDTWGIKAGIVPYKISWCSAYNFQSAWIDEPSAFCSFKNLSEGTSSGTGLQVFKTVQLQDWSTDVQVGVYDNTIYNNMNGQGAIYKLTGILTADDRIGASINALNMKNGIQVRLSALQTWQHISATNYKDYNYQTYFAGIEFEPSDVVTIKLTTTAYVGTQSNPLAGKIEYHAINSQAEANWKLSDKDTIGVGAEINSTKTHYVDYNLDQSLYVPSYSFSIRHNFDNNVYMILQAKHSESNYQPAGQAMTMVEGSAIGLQIGKNF